MYEILTWPEVQQYMEIPGFENNSYLVNDEKGLEQFGSSAYFVKREWIEEINKII